MSQDGGRRKKCKEDRRSFAFWMHLCLVGTRVAGEVAGDDKVAIGRTMDKEKDTVFDGWVQFEM